MGRYVCWKSILEKDIREMLTQYYTDQGFQVEITHGGNELGADLHCRRSDDEDERLVIIKRSPGQGDLGQVQTGRRNFSGQLEYYYSGKPSGPFVAGIREIDENIILHDEDEMEDLMVKADNFYVFYFSFRFHPALESLANIIVDIFRRCEDKAPGVPEKEEVTETDLLNFYEGTLESREIVQITLNDISRHARAAKNKDQEKKEHIRSNSMRLIGRQLRRLAKVCSNKLEVVRTFPKDYLFDALYGRKVWGTTVFGSFASEEDDLPTHRARVLDAIIHGVDYEFQYSGVVEAAYCLQSMNWVMKTLKQQARNLVESSLDIKQK